MKLPPLLHPWQVSTQEAIRIQQQLTKMIEVKKPSHPLNKIAGLDAAFTGDKKNCIAAAVLWDIAEKKLLEYHIAVRPIHFPYIPGFLSFREGEALLAALSMLTNIPDALMCDGQGLAHPRRLGIACHLGILTQMTAIGCAKSRLIGHYQEPGKNRGDHSPLFDKQERIGTVLRTKTNTKPVFVSVGHKVDLETAEEIVLQCFNGYRLPEPTRLADKLVSQAKCDMSSI